MAYPARLEVTSLLSSGGRSGDGDGGALEQGRVGLCGAVDSSTLTPVCDTSTQGPPPPLFVIADTSRKVKSAGGVAAGRIVPVGAGGVVGKDTQSPARLSVSSRPRSSPCIGRRHTKVTPFPAPAGDQQDPPPPPPAAALAEAKSQPQTVLSRVADEIRDTGKSLVPGKLPKWNRERRKVSHCGDTNLKDSCDKEGGPAVPTSSLDTEGNEVTTSTPTNGSYFSPKEKKSPLWGTVSPWSGGGTYPVPTINIASDSTPSSQKRWRRPYCTSSASERSECNTTLEHSRYVTERIHHLVSAFSQRASRVKAQITQPPTPSAELSEEEEDEPPKPAQRLDSMVGEPSSRSPSPNDLVGVSSRKAWFLRKARAIKRALTFPTSMEPQSTLYISWLFIVSIVYLYNAWVIPLRTVFSEYQTSDNLAYWLSVDYVSDLVYVMDILVFKSRVKYIDNGFWVGTPKRIRKHYVKSKKFIYDVVSLLPLDLLYLIFGPISVFRLPRLLKIHTFWEFFDRLDTVLSSPHAVRLLRTVMNMIYLIHLDSCAYYGFSKLEGIGSNQWVFQGVGNAYIRCFYFATKTATSIGKNPKPTNEGEYVFMTCAWLMGVFVFALILGQIRDIVATATRNQNEYLYMLDQAQAYVQRLNVPSELAEKVRLWFTYTWQNQKTLDEMRWLETLPKKMRTDIAISVHIQTLSKVQLFQDCDKALLRDLVLKLYPVLYMPGDYVCKKGEVGKEMYIVQTGQVQVMGGEKGDVVLATLGEGSVFGEISLLALAGGNRRTANVQSRGFSNLFVLSKADLQDTIKDYPEAQEILKKKAKKLIKQNEAREKKETKDDDNVIIKSREATPKLLHTVLQVVPPDSYTASLIRRSSRTFSRSTMDIPSSVSLSPAGGMWSWTPSPKFHLSSASLEVPNRNSRRSSLEVPTSNARSSLIAKTSMSESLPEEDEEEILVVETSEMSDESDGRPLGSPSSLHSISFQLRSRSCTPQSMSSYAMPPTVVPSPNPEWLHPQQTTMAEFQQNMPQLKDYNFDQNFQGSDGLPQCQSLSPRSHSTLSSHSPATPTNKVCTETLKTCPKSHALTAGESTVNHLSKSQDVIPRPQKHDNNEDYARDQSDGSNRKQQASPKVLTITDNINANSFSDSERDGRVTSATLRNKSPHSIGSSKSRGTSATCAHQQATRGMKGTNCTESDQQESDPNKSRNPSAGLSQQNHQNALNTSDPLRRKVEGGLLNHQEKTGSDCSSCGSAKEIDRNLNHECDNEGCGGDGMPAEVTENFGSTVDDFLFKFGIACGSEGSAPVHNNSNYVPDFDTATDGDSYDLFFNELSKTMPDNQMSMTPSMASLNSSASLLDSRGSPRSPGSSRIYCSAIVHRECSPSPESSPSPFDAKESRL